MAKDTRLYAKLALDFDQDRKILPLSSDAFRALVEAILWSRRNLSDGLLPIRLALARWSPEVLHELCNNDNTNPSLSEVEEGYLIHDFAQHQDTKAEVEARRIKASAAGRLGGLARAKQAAKPRAKRTLSRPLSKTQAETETETHKRTTPLVTPNGITQGVGAHTKNREPEPPETNGQRDGPPPKFCDQHPTGTDQPCRACATARHTAETRAADDARHEADERAARRAAIDNCPLCEDTGLRETPAGLIRCAHETRVP